MVTFGHLQENQGRQAFSSLALLIGGVVMRTSKHSWGALSIALISVVLISGCATLAGQPQGSQGDLSVSTEELAEREATLTEKEYCASSAALAEILPAAFPDQGGVEVLKPQLASMLGMTSLLAGEGSLLHPVAISLNSTVIRAGISLQAQIPSLYAGLIYDALEDFADAAEKLKALCSQIGAVENSFEISTPQVNQLFPDGFWLSSGDSIGITFQLTNLEGSFWLDEQEPTWSSTPLEPETAYDINVNCFPSYNARSIHISKRQGLMTEVSMGPSGPANFLYAIDDGPLIEADGIFAEGWFFPFYTELSVRPGNRSTAEAMEAFFGVGSTLRIVVDYPGVEIDASFPTIGREAMLSDFDLLGCNDF